MVTSQVPDAAVLPNDSGRLEAFVPALQREDGSYIGTDTPSVIYGFSNLVAVGAAGGILWKQPVTSTPTYITPLYATAGGGMIVQSKQVQNCQSNPPHCDTVGTPVIYTLDVAGSPTAQVSDSGAQISWKGHWYGSLMSVANVTSLAEPPIILAETLGSISAAFGNLSKTGAAARPWYFILAWQNDFTFEAEPSLLQALTTDITYLAPSIKGAALRELKDAYSGFPVTVLEGTSGTGDDWAVVLNSQNILPTSFNCGVTDTSAGNVSPIDLRVHSSQVDYLRNMEEAQSAYAISINNSAEEALALKRVDLIRGIGRGIGTTAAHEIAHHFLTACCDMDADPAQDLNARGTFNATGCSGDIDPSPWTGFWPNPVIGLHWEPPTLQGLTQCLHRGWRNFGGSACFTN